MRPRDARTFDDVCRLQADNYPHDPKRKGAILIEGPVVHIYGELDDGTVKSVTMSRKDFSRIVDWWNRDQIMREK